MYVRLIDAAALRDELEKLYVEKTNRRGYSGGWCDALDAAIDALEDAETIDTVYKRDTPDFMEAEYGD